MKTQGIFIKDFEFLQSKFNGISTIWSVGDIYRDLVTVSLKSHFQYRAPLPGITAKYFPGFSKFLENFEYFPEKSALKTKKKSYI